MPTQPYPLWFSEEPITVVPAPEPSDILWENLEISPESRLFRQTITYLVMFCLIVGSIIALSAAQHQKTDFANSVPNLSACNLELPAVAYQPNPVPAGAQLTHVQSQDGTCGGSSHYITYVANGVESNTSNTWGCPLIGGRPSRRCVSTGDNSPAVDTCAPVNATTGAPMPSFLLNTVPACFCLNVRGYTASVGSSPSSSCVCVLCRR